MENSARRMFLYNIESISTANISWVEQKPLADSAHTDMVWPDARLTMKSN